MCVATVAEVLWWWLTVAIVGIVVCCYCYCWHCFLLLLCLVVLLVFLIVAIVVIVVVLVCLFPALVSVLIGADVCCCLLLPVLSLFAVACIGVYCGLHWCCHCGDCW